MIEAEIIGQLRAGSEHAFKQIFSGLNYRLCFFARSFVNDPAEAEDIVQDAFIKLWDRRETFNDLTAVKAFLYLSVKNACINYAKHVKVADKYLSALDNPIDDQIMVNKIIESEVLEEIHKALIALPEGSRKIIQLSYFDGLSNQEVADYLKKSINTVKTQKVRALRTLRVLLQEVSPVLLLLIKQNY